MWPGSLQASSSPHFKFCYFSGVIYLHATEKSSRTTVLELISESDTFDTKCAGYCFYDTPYLSRHKHFLMNAGFDLNENRFLLSENFGNVKSFHCGRKSLLIYLGVPEIISTHRQHFN